MTRSSRLPAIGAVLGCMLVAACSTSSRTPICPPGQVPCAERCIDPRTERAFCGASGDCAAANAGTACLSGEVCSSGSCALECGGATPLRCGDGCVDPSTDRHNCGGCGGAGGEVCSAAADCIDGACQGSCPSPLRSCLSSEETLYCADTQNDPHNCGACGSSGGSAICTAEPGAMPACIQGTCSELCQHGRADCDRDLGTGGNGCETDVLDDPQNCGGCGDAATGAHECVTAEAHALSSCEAGACGAVCEPLRGDCDGDLGTGGTGCEVDLGSSGEHCGACNSPCATDCCGGSCMASCPADSARNPTTCECGPCPSFRAQIASSGKALDYSTHWNDQFYYEDQLNQDGSGTGFPWAGFGSGVFAILNPLIDDLGSPVRLVPWDMVRIWVLRTSEFVDQGGCKYPVDGKDVSSSGGTPDLIWVQRTESMGAGSILVWQAPLVDRRPGAAPIAEGEPIVVVVQRPNEDGSFDDVIDPRRDILDGQLAVESGGWVGFRVVNVAP